MPALDLLPDDYAVCRLPAGSALPPGLVGGGNGDRPGVVSVTWTADEVSVICRADLVPDGASAEAPWRCLRAAGPLDFALTGVLASMVAPLAAARVAIMAFSTYDTDYILVPSVRLAEAVATLDQAGHPVTA
ncbi:ACT domain-containing protein [Asanoa iriomotensis]|uniref:ACT domain-containing protein n=1 Tax=Asanoa iriomotensis TaxID=234613 RepID=A0ABQ4C0N3_9ACTN|nr:ACT domain-containing protein [Asanoa iriomotensis]GIF56322.1 ACT domain-containing protein [Asanoa iriomotensis]